MNGGTEIMALIFATALATYLLRSLPLLFFGRPMGNAFFKAFLDALPYALLSAMIFPAVFYSTGGARFPSPPQLPALAGACTALLLGYMRRSLPAVALAATGVAYLCALLLQSPA